ncbi:MAG: DUF1211 domain-containing protein [Kangiellaceae bacterium]|nr:DUF1211 domain-containing protein [Kangiellaceae bacterium]
MNKLSQAFLDSCNTEQGFIMRGENMTRIETFVDAAFAFAITMLVISVDEIPTSVEGLLNSARDIPAFLASGIQIGLIWHWHSIFSRRFGLQDGKTVVLSLGLVMLVLIFIYPLKLVFMGLFNWISGSYLSPGLGGMQESELAAMFTYFGVGFLVLSVISLSLYRNALNLRDALRLSEYEVYTGKTQLLNWVIITATAIVSIIIAQTASGLWITGAGFIYFSLIFSSRLLKHTRAKRAPAT